MDSHKAEYSLTNTDYDSKSSIEALHHAVKREKEDPSSGRESISPWVLFLCGFILVVGGGYLGAYNAGFDMDAYTVNPDSYVAYNPLETGGGGEIVITPEEAWVKAGKRAYETAGCIGCHGRDGLGSFGKGYPPLKNSEWVIGGTEKLGLIVWNGLKGPVQVDGKNYGAEVMNPNKESLKNAKNLAQVMSYIRSEWGNYEKLGGDLHKILVTEEMAQQVIDMSKERKTPYTIKELESIPADRMLSGAPFGTGSEQEEETAE